MENVKNKYRKLNYAFISLLLLLFIISCKKNKLDLYEVEVKAEIPYDYTPIPGVKFTVIEYQSTGQLLSSEPTGWQMVGITDANGYAKVSFTKKKKETSKYYYYAHFDYSNVQCPYPNYSIINSPSFIVVNPNLPSSVYLRVLPYMDIQFKFLNMNCVDANDTFKYKFKNADEWPWYTFQDSDPWFEGPELNGCVDVIGGSSSRLAGHYVFNWEAIRGGVLESGRDTFLLTPYGNNIANMEW